MRVVLFTDTLGDVNGVSRFIRNAAARARASERELTVITSTRLEVPREANIINIAPRLATRMPKYENLEIVWPRRGAMARAVEGLRPDVIHVSTPGPVGIAGRKIARRLGVPLVGTYHTDFPAYVSHLVDDTVCTYLTTRLMRWFYRPFAAVFTRSAEYADIVAGLGVERERVHRLKPGIDLSAFGTERRDIRVWNTIPGAEPGAVKVLYCGRVSVEKNLPMLERAWTRARAALEARGVGGVRAQLVVIGDGPYRAAMQRGLEGLGALFLGFRHGEELARLYASGDVFVFPSLTDTLGQVVMEAQASGLPVIVGDEGGPREVVRDGETGLVVAGRDERAWAGAIERLAGDAAQRGAMGAAAAQWMRGFSFAASFEHFWSVHEAVARQDGAAAEGRG